MNGELIIQFVGTAGVIFLAAFLIRREIRNDQKRWEKLNEEALHKEAETLSQKLRDSRVEMGVRKPQSFNKRKPQKPSRAKAS
jgi:hypothetical protein